MTEIRVGSWLVDDEVPLGRGNFARVLRARRERPEIGGVVEHRAMKIYDVRGDAERMDRALDEIRVQEQLLGCPHAVAYVDGFLVDDGPYAGCVVQVMELGDRSLHDHLAEVGPLTGAAAAAALHGVAEALDHVHRRRLVHADLKPGNIVRCQGLWKIADFNVASTLLASAAWDVGGTPLYMSPQRLRALADGRAEVRPADDMWALGMVLAQCMLGRLPGRDPRDGAELSGGPAGRAAEVLAALNASAAADRPAVELVRDLLADDPHRRPTAARAAARLRAMAVGAAHTPTVRNRTSAFAVTSFGDPHIEVFADDDRSLHHGWRLRGSWSGWHPMDAPATARALAAGCPATHRQNLWLLDDGGHLWRRELTADPETGDAVGDWSPWEPCTVPAVAPLVDISATGAPWNGHRLLAVDAAGLAWHRRWHPDEDGWSPWAQVPGAPERLTCLRPAVASGGLAAVDRDGVVWHSPGAGTGRWRTLPRDGRSPARAVAPLPDETVVVLADENVELVPGGMITDPLPPAPPGPYTSVAATSRWNGHLELVLGRSDGGLVHTWANRGTDGHWRWNPEWWALRNASRPRDGAGASPEAAR